MSSSLAAQAHLNREARRIFELWQRNRATAAIDAIVIHGVIQAAYLTSLVSGMILAPLTVQAREELAAFQGGISMRIRG